MGVRTDTRDRMVASAALMLRERGVAGTSIARVLTHARGPRGSVQFHFPGGKAQLVVEALTWAGAFVTALLADAARRTTPPDEVLDAVCRLYADQLVQTDYRAGCPIGAAAQESFDDPALAPTIASVIDAWTTGFADVLMAAGHDPTEAGELATLCIAAVEGAITLARVEHSTRPLEQVSQRIGPLLART